jgi:hypothetical protein
MNRGLKHMAVAVFTAASLIVSPGFAQPQEAQPQNAGTPGQPANQPQGQTTPPGPVQPRDIILGADYSRESDGFPIRSLPLFLQVAAPPPMTNSQRIDS